MNREDAEEFTQTIGQIVSGSWRQIALAKRLGVPEALGLDTESWVRGRLGGYIRLSIEDRREAVAELTAEGHSTREVGEVLGVDQRTVRRDAANAAGNGQAPANEDGDAANAAVEPDADPAKLHMTDLVEQYRRLAYSHTTHEAAALRDKQRAGFVLVELEQIINAAKMDWWEFYRLNFDKAKKWAEQALKLAKEG